MDRKAYVLTELAGDWVAGAQVRIGGAVVLGTAAVPLMLTDRQAEHELRLKSIEPLLPTDDVTAEAVRSVEARARKARGGEDLEVVASAGPLDHDNDGQPGGSLPASARGNADLWAQLEARDITFDRRWGRRRLLALLADGGN